SKLRAPEFLLYGVCVSTTGNRPGAGVPSGFAGRRTSASRRTPSLIGIRTSVVFATPNVAGRGVQPPQLEARWVAPVRWVAGPAAWAAIGAARTSTAAVRERTRARIVRDLLGRTRGRRRSARPVYPASSQANLAAGLPSTARGRVVQGADGFG